MTTMTHPPRVVTAGVDTHRDQHTVAVIDDHGRHIGTAQFPTTPSGYRQLATWVAAHGETVRYGIEGTGSYGKGLTRFLTAHGVEVREVTRTSRQHRRRHGKSDPTDALAAARAVYSGQATAVPRSGNGPIEAMRVIRVARNSAVTHQRRLLDQIKALVLTAPDELRQQLEPLTNIRLVATCRRLRPDTNISDPLTATKMALKTLAEEHHQLTQHAETLRGHLDTLTRAAAPPELLEQTGLGPVTTTDLMIAYGDNPARIRTEAAFAALCGVSAVDASSGRQQRHRLNRGGDRHANAALHRIVMVRLRHDPQTRNYLNNRLNEGKTRKEAIRCLKRLIARDIYYTLNAHPPPTCSP